MIDNDDDNDDYDDDSTAAAANDDDDDDDDEDGDVISSSIELVYFRLHVYYKAARCSFTTPRSFSEDNTLRITLTMINDDDVLKRWLWWRWRWWWW